MVPRNAAYRAACLLCVFGLFVAVGLWWLFREPNHRRYTAEFRSVVGLFEGSDVRVLGVRVGVVDSIVPRGDRVEVGLLVDRTVDVPREVWAAIVAPSLVSDRYVQLPPAGGDEALAAGGVIPLDRTFSPLEIDDLYASLDRVVRALGPEGANRSGALSDLLTVLAGNLQGNGDAIHTTVTDLSRLSSTLSARSPDLFATVDHLARFTGELARADGDVERFLPDLAEATRFLAGEREALRLAVAELGTALGAVRDFINDNRATLGSTVDRLTDSTRVLVDQRAALAETLDIGPLAVTNGLNAIGAEGLLHGRPNLNELTADPLTLVCRLVRAAPEVCRGVVPLPSPAQVVDGLLPLPVTGLVYAGA